MSENTDTVSGVIWHVKVCRVKAMHCTYLIIEPGNSNFTSKSFTILHVYICTHNHVIYTVKYIHEVHLSELAVIFAQDA